MEDGSMPDRIADATDQELWDFSMQALPPLSFVAYWLLRLWRRHDRRRVSRDSPTAQGRGRPGAK